MCGWCCGGTPLGKRGSGHSGCSEDCFNAPRPRSRKIAPPVTVTDAMVERMQSWWNSDSRPNTHFLFKDEARAALTAALHEGGAE